MHLLHFLVAEVGFEPHGLRVMSPTSYQTAPLRDIWCRKPVSNRYDTFVSRDFKSRASANSAIPANGAWVTLFYPDCLTIIPHQIAFVNPFYAFYCKYLSTNFIFS